MNRKYHFITASTLYYSGNNFGDLLEEEKKYDGYIYWKINGNGGVHKIEENDRCLIYYSKLPDGSSRIIFVGEVVESDYNEGTLNAKSICPDADKGEKYAKLKLKSVSLEDSSKFSLESLRKKYHLISDKGRFSYLIVRNDKHQELINDIEESLKNKHYLEYVNNYFNENYCSCEFGCKSFIEENGFYYVESHHLVERNLINKNSNIKGIDKLINNPSNLFNLCANCHMKIHHVKVDERRQMINTLYMKNKQFFDNNFNELKNGMKTIEWLYEIYKCNK